MKCSIYFLVLFVFSLFGFAQIPNDSNRDSQWLTGYCVGNCIQGSSFGLTVWEFSNSITFDSIYPFTGFQLTQSNSCICNISGNLILSCNGYKVTDQFGNIIVGGDSLGFGFFFLHYPSLRIPDGTVILPWPGHDSLYIILHQRFNHFPPDTFPQQIWIGELLYSVVNASDNCKIVLSKNNRIIQDTLTAGFAVTRHANGRDWWIVQPAIHESKFFKVLISPAGIYSVDIQYTQSEFGELINECRMYFSSTFSSNGTTYVISSFQPFSDIISDKGYLTIRVFDFDRCTGEFSNERFFRDTLVDKGIQLHTVISPGSNYLYLTTISQTIPMIHESQLFQFDLNVQDFGSTKLLVGEYDGFIDPGSCTPCLFGDLQIGLDGKIYIEGTNTRWIHVIDYPDNLGLSCGFVQRKILLPTYTGFSLPHFPNYRLGPLYGSVCDSLTAGIEVLEPANTVFSVFPNPVADYLQVSWDKPSGGKCGYYLINSLGAVIQAGSFQLSGRNYTISLNEVPEGMYLINLLTSSGETETQKLVILRP